MPLLRLYVIYNYIHVHANATNVWPSVWRKKHVQCIPDCVNFKVKNPLSVQVWGALSYYGKSQLKMVNWNLKSVKYQNEIFKDIKLKCDCLAYPMRNFIFMYDKAPCHFSASTQRYLADRE